MYVHIFLYFSIIWEGSSISDDYSMTSIKQTNFSSIHATITQLQLPLRAKFIRCRSIVLFNHPRNFPEFRVLCIPHQGKDN